LARSRDAQRQQKTPTGACLREEAVKPQGTAGGQSAPSAQPERPSPGSRFEALLEQMVERNNMLEALKRVEKNDGAPGMDGMETKDLRLYIRQHWERIRTELLNGTYEPQPARRVETPRRQATSGYPDSDRPPDSAGAVSDPHAYL
jgi:RNA-directed DNA polymerase